MSFAAILPAISEPIGIRSESQSATRPNRVRKGLVGTAGPVAKYAQGNFPVEGTGQRQAELFYLQKQIQTQTPMVIVLEDGEQIEGLIEWYDRNSMKVRGRAKSLIYKSAIKYMYKVGEAG